MRILVTGAGGQLGRALARRAGLGGGVAASDGIVTAFGEGLAAFGEAVFVDRATLDITDAGAIERVFERVQPDVVVNCAAWTDVDAAERHPGEAFRVNADGVGLLAERVARTGVAMIHISTDFVFDGAAQQPYIEQDTPALQSVYGASKLTGERAMLGSGCRGIIVRTSWLYSPWGRNFVRSIVAAATQKAALRPAEREIHVVSDQLGSPTSADSLAAAIERLIPHVTPGLHLPASAHGVEILNFCNSGVVSRADFAVEIIALAGLDCRVVPVTTAQYEAMMSTKTVSEHRLTAIRPVYSALDTSKIAREFAITPPLWRDALRPVIEELIYPKR